MAQSEGPPRKTTTYNIFEGMNTQSERYGIEKEWFAWLENIMWVGPHKLHSVPGPRAVGTIPPPPPPPETPSCPPEPTLTHIDSGFTQIFTSNYSLNQTTDIAYFAGATSPSLDFITAFDMVAATVIGSTQGNGKRLYQPCVDPTNGDVYVGDFTLSTTNQQVAQIHPDTLAVIRTSAQITQMRVGTIRISANTIYVTFSSASINSIFALNKTNLTVNWSTFTPGSSLGVGNRLSGFCVDGNGDLWVHTHQSGTTENNSLIKFDEGSGVGTLHDITSTHPLGTFLNLAFDPINNIILITGNDTLVSKFDVNTFVDTLLNTTSAGIDVGTMLNGVVEGKFWANTATTLKEWDIASDTLGRTILKVDIVGGTTVTNWTSVVMMTALQCLIATHGAFPAHPIGGVDRICLPC